MPILRSAFVMLATLVPALAWGQTAPAVPGRSPWSLEIFTGAGASSQSSSGTALDRWPVGATFTTEAGTPSRLQSTWRFGDGAAHFNEVAAQFSQLLGRSMPTIVPLDDLLRSPAARPGTHTSMGLRLARRISPAWAIEVSIERQNGGLTLDDRWDESLERARASFASAFTEIFSTAPVTGLTVESTVTRPQSSQTHTRLVATVTRTLATRGRWAALGTAGGGVQLTGGEPAEISLRGHYTVNPFNFGPFVERDDVRIRFEDPPEQLVAVAGVGVVVDATARTAFRLDATFLITPNRATTTVQSLPTAGSSNAPVLTTQTSPGLQFSNQSVPVSTLNAAGGTQYSTFTGSGINRQFRVTVGVVARF